MLIGGPFYRCPRFSLACTGTLAPLLTSVMSKWAGWGFTEATLMSVSVSGAFGLLVWQMLESRIKVLPQQSIYKPVVLSIGVWIVFESLVTFIAGSSARLMEPETISNQFVNGRFIGAFVGFVVAAMMLMPPAQRIWHAAWNPELAEIFGISESRSAPIFVFASHLMIASAGIVAASGTGFTPRHGLALFFAGMTVYVLGGLRSWLGCALSAAFLAAVRLIFGIQFGTHWADSATFIILIGFFIWRPLGFKGQRLKKVEL